MRTNNTSTTFKNHLLIALDLSFFLHVDLPEYCKTPAITVAWRSGNTVGRINEVTLRRARLVLGWMTSTGSTPGGGTLFRYVTSHAGRLSLSSFRGR